MAKVLTGPRAVISVDGQIVGLFESCSYGANIGVEAIHILGRHSASEIVNTSYEAVSVQCSGFRVIGNGAHVLPKFPKVQDLVNLGTVTISIRDRQTGELIANVIGCVPTSYSTGVNAKSTSRISVSYLGLILSDESGNQSEGAGAADLP